MKKEEIDKIKEIRRELGVGYSKAKSTLENASWNLEKAIQILKERGFKKTRGEATFSGKAVFSRISEDKKYGIMLSIQSETDFVIKEKSILEFGDELVDSVFKSKCSKEDVDNIQLGNSGKTIKERISELSVYFSEQLKIEDVFVFDSGYVYSYLHKSVTELPANLGVMLSLDTDNDDIASPLLYTLATYKPLYMKLEDIEKSRWDSECEELMKSDFLKGKEERIREKAVRSKVESEFSKNTFYQLKLVTDNTTTVAGYLKQNSVVVNRYVCL